MSVSSLCFHNKAGFRRQLAEHKDTEWRATASLAPKKYDLQWCHILVTFRGVGTFELSQASSVPIPSPYAKPN